MTRRSVKQTVDVLDRLAEKLDEHEIPYTRTQDSISVDASDDSGFDVGIHLNGDGYTVSFEGWHEEFSSPEEAMNCFAFGLSPDSRLAVTYRGPVPTKWVLEYKENEEWKTESITGLLIPPFWRKRVVYKQNHYLPAV